MFILKLRLESANRRLRNEVFNTWFRQVKTRTENLKPKSYDLEQSSNLALAILHLANYRAVIIYGRGILFQLLG